MPSQVRGLTSSVDALTELVQSLVSNIEDLKQQQQRTARLFCEKEENCEKLITENAPLHQRVADVAASSRVLGSSIIRDVDQNKLVATKCICIPGGHINNIQAKVPQFPAGNRHCRAVLVVGGNDCDGRQDTPISDMLAQYKDLIEGAKSIATSVTVSSPRCKSTELNEGIDTLNGGLQGICDDLQVEYVDHSPSFKLQDGTFNEGFVLPDCVHLTRAATNKLVSNLCLESRQGEVTTHRDHRRRAEGDGPAEDAAQTPGSPEQPDLDYSFWQTVTKKFRPCKPKPTPPPNRLGHSPRDLPTQAMHAPITKVCEWRLVAIVTRTWRHPTRLPGKPASMAPPDPRRGPCPPHSWTSPPTHWHQPTTCPLRFP